MPSLSSYSRNRISNLCVFFFFQYVGNALFLAFSFSYLQRYWSWYISTADAWGNHWCWKYAVQLHAKKHSSMDEPPAMDTDRNTASVLEVTGFIEITSKNTEMDSLNDKWKDNKPFIFMWLVQIWSRSVTIVHWWPVCHNAMYLVAGIVAQIKLMRNSRSALYFTIDFLCDRGCHWS